MDDLKKKLEKFKVDFSVFGQNQGDSIWIERSDFRAAAKTLLELGYISNHYSIFKVEQGFVVSLFFSRAQGKFDEPIKSMLFVLRMSIDNHILPCMGGMYEEVETYYAKIWNLTHDQEVGAK